MIKIECSKAQFERIIKAMTESNLTNNTCVLGKTAWTCPQVNDSHSTVTCEKCIRDKVVRL